MVLTEVDNILHIYKQLSQYPSLVLAKVISITKNVITVQCLWSQTNVERQKKQKFIQEFTFDAELQPVVESFSVDVSSEIITSSSDDDKLKAILREVIIDGKVKQFIEIWDKQHIIKSYDLSAFDIHKDVYSIPIFSAFHWSLDNKRLLYIAEKKLTNCEPFYKQKNVFKTNKPNNEETPLRGEEYIFKPDWGEQLVGKHKSVVIVLNIEEDTITPVSTIPDYYFPAQVIWTPNGNDIVGVAYKLGTRYLGLYACTNRESYIFHLKGSEFRVLTSEGFACRSPRFSPDGKYLIWLERKISLPHHHVHRLMYINWNVLETVYLFTPNALIDTVEIHTNIYNKKDFYGLYNQNLPKRCWSNDSKYIFFSTPQRCNIKSYIVDIETKRVIEIHNPDESSLSVLDVRENFIVFTKFSPIQPPQLVIGKFNSVASDIENIHLYCYTNMFNMPGIETLIYDNTEFIYSSNDFVNDFNFTYFGKKSLIKKSMPLIAIPHGGPHSAFSNEFNLNHTVFAFLGFGILLINYRGSIGMGGNNVEYILGKVGESDVIDCKTAINAALKKYDWLDPENVSLYGGSHGGFLSAHLSGQYPEMFRCVILRNPVIDVAAMFSISDIPDWCLAESGYINCEQMQQLNYCKLIHIMLNHSPIIHVDKVKAPTFIALGSNDLRVPPSQGKMWYHRLSLNNIPTKLHIYEDNHSLSKDDVEIDFIINAALWLTEHTKLTKG